MLVLNDWGIDQDIDPDRKHAWLMDRNAEIVDGLDFNLGMDLHNT